MTAQCEITAKKAEGAELGNFARCLTAWVALCVVAEIALGQCFPDPLQITGEAQVPKLNMPEAILIWLMIIPILLKIGVRALHHVKELRRGVGVTLFINWSVKLFSMAGLGMLSIGYLIRDMVPADQKDSCIAALIILAAGPCTAMLFVWRNLSDGEPHCALTQVAWTDTIMVFAFGPVVGIWLGLSSIMVPRDTLLIFALAVIVIPVIVSYILRSYLLKSGGELALDKVLAAPDLGWLLALLGTLVLLFGFQGEQILAEPLVIVLLAVPILIQVYFNSSLSYFLNRQFGVAHCVAAPSVLTGATKFFKLGVATAIGLFGLDPTRHWQRLSGSSSKCR